MHYAKLISNMPMCSTFYKHLPWYLSTCFVIILYTQQQILYIGDGYLIMIIYLLSNSFDRKACLHFCNAMYISIINWLPPCVYKLHTKIQTKIQTTYLCEFFPMLFCTLCLVSPMPEGINYLMTLTVLPVYCYILYVYILFNLTTHARKFALPFFYK